MLSSGLPCPSPVKSMCDRRRVRATIPRKSGVRKALFGPVDHTELQRDLDEQMAILKAADKDRWNFDFNGESPLPGRFDWERVEDCSPEVPTAYAMSCLTVCGLGSAVPVRYTNSRFVRNTTDSGVPTPLRVPADAASQEEAETRTTATTEENKATQQKIIQAKISTFFPVKRRTTENSESPAKRRRRHVTHQRASETVSSQ